MPDHTTTSNSPAQTELTDLKTPGMEQQYPSYDDSTVKMIDSLQGKPAHLDTSSWYESQPTMIIPVTAVHWQGQVELLWAVHRDDLAAEVDEKFLK